MSLEPHKTACLVAFAKAVVLFVFSIAVTIWLDGYVTIESPGITILANAAPFFGLCVVVWLLTARIVFAASILTMIAAVVVLIDVHKWQLLESNLLWADIRMTPALMKSPKLVAGFANQQPVPWGMIAGCLAVAALGWFLLVDRWSAFARRMTAAAALVGLLVVSLVNGSPEVRLVNWSVYTQVTGAQQAGLFGNLMFGYLATIDPVPKPDRSKAESFWKLPGVSGIVSDMERAAGSVKPDIILVLAESLFEPAGLCGFPDTPVLTAFRAAQPGGGGLLSVPVFGGRTLQTEFEVLSGTRIADFPASMFSYYDLLDRPIESLPRALNRNGYRSIAVHPNRRVFWNRDIAFAQLGFDEFASISSFLLPREGAPSGFVSDRKLFEFGVSLLDRPGPPKFLFLATIDNHGPWAPGDGTNLPGGLKLGEQSKGVLSSYLAGVMRTNEALEYLVDYVLGRERPTLLFVFGDHMPALGSVYDETCFKNKVPAAEQQLPFGVWANYDIGEVQAKTSGHLVPGHLMRWAKLKPDGHLLANAVIGMAELRGMEEMDKSAAEAYRQLSALNLRGERPVEAPVFRLPREQATSTLMSYESGRVEPYPIEMRWGDIHMHPGRKGPAELRFELPAGMRRIGLRPYIGTLSDQCRANPEAGVVRLQALIDGKVVHDTTVRENSVNPMSILTPGGGELTFRADKGNGTETCDWLYIRVTELVCDTPDC